MLTSPVGGGRKRTIGLASFSLGLAVGGCTTALLLWLVSGLVSGVPPGWREAVLVGCGVLALARDTRVLTFPLPQQKRQVPQTIFFRGTALAALQFGFELGTGVRTYLPATAPYVLALAIWLLADDVVIALLAGLGFGAGRAAMALTRASSEDGDQWDAALTRRATVLPPIGSALILVAIVLLTTLV